MSRVTVNDMATSHEGDVSIVDANGNVHKIGTIQKADVSFKVETVDGQFVGNIMPVKRPTGLKIEASITMNITDGKRYNGQVESFKNTGYLPPLRITLRNLDSIAVGAKQTLLLSDCFMVSGNLFKLNAEAQEYNVECELAVNNFEILE